LADVVVDLGMSPLCESYVSPSGLNRMEPFYPLIVYVCRSCWLVQLEEYVAPDEIFTEYAYFSSYASSWVEHARAYVDDITRRLQLGAKSFVLEVASNDGYLLQHFLPRGVPVLGIEPAANVAKAAEEKGVPTRVAFFGERCADALRREGRGADLVIGNNVLAQVPDLNDFVRGLGRVLNPGGTITLEFPHLLRLFRGNQFDTIYHEHFSYFSALAVGNTLNRHGLIVYDVEELPTHGGSLRIFATHAAWPGPESTGKFEALVEDERRNGFEQVGTYTAFSEQVRQTKRDLLAFLIEIKREGKRIAGYGAPGKGNTLLNYCGIGRDFIDFTVDRNPYKQGKYLPGTHIPIHEPAEIDRAKPDYILILPWNFKEEIKAQLAHVKDWGARFVIPIPKPGIEE
jgi:SAM-dependent methyltransferase